MAARKVLLAVYAIALLVAAVAASGVGDLEALQNDVNKLEQKIEKEGCDPTNWSAPVDEASEDLLEIYQERVEELQDELEECFMQWQEEEEEME